MLPLWESSLLHWPACEHVPLSQCSSHHRFVLSNYFLIAYVSIFNWIKSNTSSSCFLSIILFHLDVNCCLSKCCINKVACSSREQVLNVFVLMLPCFTCDRSQHFQSRVFIIHLSIKIDSGFDNVKSIH